MLTSADRKCIDLDERDEMPHRYLSYNYDFTQLALSHHQWSKALDEGKPVDVVFLDFAKAFDRVAHNILLQKLCNFCISGAL